MIISKMSNDGGHIQGDITDEEKPATFHYGTATEDPSTTLCLSVYSCEDPQNLGPPMYMGDGKSHHIPTIDFRILNNPRYFKASGAPDRTWTHSQSGT
jgi:hypothetical protein